MSLLGLIMELAGMIRELRHQGMLMNRMESGPTQ